MSDGFEEPPVKVVLLGNSSVGKTTILLQLMRNVFTEETESTVGASYLVKSFSTRRGNTTLQIWDTAGQERFYSIVPFYLRGCQAVIFCCALDSEDSVKALNHWYTVATETEPLDDTLCIVVVNKMDLRDDDVDPIKKRLHDAAQIWAAEHDFEFRAISSKNYDQITEIFRFIAEKITQSEAYVPTQEITLGKGNQGKSKCC